MSGHTIPHCWHKSGRPASRDGYWLLRCCQHRGEYREVKAPPR